MNAVPHFRAQVDGAGVIVPSVPGFGFSDRPGRGMTRSFADIRRRVDLPRGGHFVAGTVP